MGALNAPKATLGASNAPKATLGASNAPKATLGRWLRAVRGQGFAASSWAAKPSSSDSPPGRATSCTEVGSPETTDRPAGTVIAG
ncbi:hypothetical protein [Amycolatopsis mediterranei]|uniref:hypothetical protein n=1 Tax=Amycolatopsis mediterranei TaxID=33910 RepID=UPI003331CE2A